jgi:hypothetical protein
MNWGDSGSNSGAAAAACACSFMDVSSGFAQYKTLAAADEGLKAKV